MEVMRQQDGESPLPDAIPLDGIAPTPPSLVVRVQTDQPISSNPTAPTLDNADVGRLRVTGQLAYAIRDIKAAPGPLTKLRAALHVRALVLKRPVETPSPENAGT